MEVVQSISKSNIRYQYVESSTVVTATKLILSLMCVEKYKNHISLSLFKSQGKIFTKWRKMNDK